MEIVKNLMKYSIWLMIENQNKLTKFALKYTLRTRAILGAIFKK